MNKTMLTNKLTGGLTASLSAFLIAAVCAPEATAIDYTTKAINAYDHNGKLISTQIASDVQYIEVEDYSFRPEVYSITGVDGSSVKFLMIPVIGTNSYRLATPDLDKWPANDRRAAVKTYHIGQTEVTNALWKAVMGSVPSADGTTADNMPVNNVSWNDICNPGGFLDKLNSLVKNDPTLSEMIGDREFCLPTEWEWEYAARGGNIGNPFGGSSDIGMFAWWLDNTNGIPYPVATKDANSLGLYDIIGNVWELCGEDSYRSGDGVIDLTRRPARGGGYSSAENQVSTSYRGRYLSHIRQTDIGFRLILKSRPLELKTFKATAADGSEVKFKMIPVEGTSSHQLISSSVQWPDVEKCANVNTFYIGETEVTNALWEAVMKSLPSAVGTTDANMPVNNVSWDDICNPGGFLETLNALLQDQLTGMEFGLPNEWEWEYAARGGNHRDRYSYSGSNTLEEVGWYDETSKGEPHTVAQLKKNTLGIYDMSGNVWEWCDGTSYRTGEANAVANPQRRATRGGGYTSARAICSTSYRSYNLRTTKSSSGGLRLVLRFKK